MGQYHFGSGSLYGITTDTMPTPVQFGTLQEVTIDFSSTIKELFGQNKFSDVAAQGQMKVTGKAKFGKINAYAYNKLFFNQTLTTNSMYLVSQNESGTVPSASEYTVTVANSTTFDRDLGVIYSATGLPLTRVTTLTAAGQYTCANGVYTFYSGDAGASVYISYIYTSSSSGNTITLKNAATGTATNWTGIFNGKFNSKQVTMILNACVSNKLSLISTKVEDFTVPELDFVATCDSAGILGYLSTVE
ncbi:MAG: hypothetical protein H6Q72_4286 [Firmicutes bacterium]|nr:hypothetical protein [Bacillota bacterium]